MVSFIHCYSFVYSLGECIAVEAYASMTLGVSRQELSTVPPSFTLFGLHLVRSELYWLSLHIQDGPPLFEERFP